ncbi:hypothetical protein ACRAQ7_14470 [Erythrobacter sp. W53]|uniref:hypothetical protein n=1 Tax=Erythrobacteraceae TaxID=335929 RepID=UPI0036D37E31
MREALDQWDFVVAAYVVGMFATFAMIAWAWAAMRKAEKRRDEARQKVSRK